MSNRIKKRDNNFTQVSNSFLRDNNISFKAKGLFCYMFSMNENWNFTLQSIATQQKDGLDSVKSAMDELKKYGYVTYEKLANGKGLYYLDDEPKVENPNVENPNLGKSTPIKNNNSNKNNNNKTLSDNVGYSIEFENAWEWYNENTTRPTGDKKKAYSSYLKQLKIMPNGEINGAIYNYVMECKKSNTFTKHLVSFLNGDLEQYLNRNRNTKIETKPGFKYESDMI